ncbi:hypothetical protein LTR12_005098 [Friedmanniomyces endolithicus]|nr:hypothetical protein LTR74_001735 [Friedmanniomyces endolithicus]KAK1820510.1 hypothetical protein LTR12_005098 [Friedmanniomyces endolithicus]
MNPPNIKHTRRHLVKQASRTQLAHPYDLIDNTPGTMPFLQPQRQTVSRSRASSASATPPSTHTPPPPPYQEYGSPWRYPPHPNPHYAYPYQSQQSLVPPGPHMYGHHPPAWASTSTMDIPRPRTAGAWEQGPAWGHTAVDPVRPASSGKDDCAMARRMCQGAAFCDRVAARVHEMLSRDEAEPVDIENVEHLQPESSNTGIINFRKTWLYQNSRLPPGMLPFIAYLPTWSLVCRAAKASLDVYERPHREQREGYRDADPKHGTKAFVIKSQTVDDRKLLVVAVRGSQKNRVDWAINFGFAPKQPVGFLDDAGNWCHAGFLEVARAMIGTVAAQLKRHIELDPAWAGCSLMFTGHSAGGAVASLLYMHMLSRTIDSELTVLAGVFRRVHCVTFGTPPLSLLPLRAPRNGHKDKNQFLSFCNEGDLVVRADWAYIKSLAKLIAAPAPHTTARPRLRERVSRQKLKSEGPEPAGKLRHATRWPVPDGSLSAGGRMVLLRQRPNVRSSSVEAVQLTDGELRGVVFGDPAMHRMSLYKQRVDDLAFAAVSGGDSG